MKIYIDVMLRGIKYLLGAVLVAIGVMICIMCEIGDFLLATGMTWCGFEQDSRGDWVKKNEDIIDAEWYVVE